MAAQFARDEGHARVEAFFLPGEVKATSSDAAAQLHTAQIPSLVSSCLASGVATPRWTDAGQTPLDKSPRCLNDLEQMLGEVESLDLAAHSEILRASAAMRSAIETERRFRYTGSLRANHGLRRAQRTRRQVCVGMAATLMVVGMPVLFATAVLLGTPSLLLRSS